MATRRRRWIWIIAGIAGVCLLALIAVAGAGVYFVAHHIRSEDASSAQAMRRFDDVRQRFKDARPLYEIDPVSEHPRAVRSTHELPDARVKPQDLQILAWDPEKQRVVRVSLPFWLLRFGKQKIDVMRDREFDLDRLNLDFAELERIGPALVFDFRNRDGVRVLLWTQ